MPPAPLRPRKSDRSIGCAKINCVDFDQLAVEITRARKSASLLEAPSRRLHAFSIEDGYEVGRRVSQQRLVSGARPVGVKLGFTNRAAWEAVGLASPFWSPIYEDTVTGHREVSLDALVAPRIEPEIVLGFQGDLSPGASAGEICSAIRWAAPGFEIVQCHYPDWAMTPADAIADEGLHGLLVVGDRVPGPFSAAALASTKVELMREHVVIARGSGADALGGPVEAIAWLLRLPGVDGVRADSIVTTGTLTAALPIVRGEHWRSRCSGPTAWNELEVVFS